MLEYDPAAYRQGGGESRDLGRAYLNQARQEVVHEGSAIFLPEVFFSSDLRSHLPPPRGRCHAHLPVEHPAEIALVGPTDLTRDLCQSQEVRTSSSRACASRTWVHGGLRHGRDAPGGDDGRGVRLA